jgi:hypothetical protein
MMVTHFSAWLMVAAGGLFSGGIFFVAVERLNLWQRMPVDQYVVDFRRSVWADPLMPILGMISELSAVVFALNNVGRPATLAWLGITLIGVIMVSSIVIARRSIRGSGNRRGASSPRASSNCGSAGADFTWHAPALRCCR